MEKTKFEQCGVYYPGDSGDVLQLVVLSDNQWYALQGGKVYRLNVMPKEQGAPAI